MGPVSQAAVAVRLRRHAGRVLLQPGRRARSVAGGEAARPRGRKGGRRGAEEARQGAAGPSLAAGRVCTQSPARVYQAAVPRCHESLEGLYPLQDAYLRRLGKEEPGRGTAVRRCEPVRAGPGSRQPARQGDVRRPRGRRRGGRR